MTAALSTDEPALSSVRRALVERLQHTQRALQSLPLSDDNVHTIRKQLKRARASLRLLRDALGATEYRRLNTALRDAARPLTQMRDAKVLLQALDTVVEKAGEFSQIALVDELRHALQQELRLDRTQLNADEVATIRSRLDTVARGLQNLADADFDKIDIHAAIKRAYKKARKAFKLAKREPSDENLHEWRKQVKYEFNQLELLRPLQPKRTGATIQQAHKLADRLGDDHDLAILHDRIVAQSLSTKTADADVLLQALVPARARLQRKARKLGKSLYAGKSRRKA